ncbi:MAG: hypothetical protein ACXWX6_10020 [Actinomycetota bacterium]
MRWGKMAVIGLTVLVGLGVGMVVAQPWGDPTVVDALELDDEARREDDAPDGEVRDDDDDDAGTGTRTDGGRSRDAATDDGRDGTREGDTSNGRGTGTGDSGVPAAGVSATNGGGGGSASGGASRDSDT